MVGRADTRGNKKRRATASCSVPTADVNLLQDPKEDIFFDNECAGSTGKRSVKECNGLDSMVPLCGYESNVLEKGEWGGKGKTGGGKIQVIAAWSLVEADPSDLPLPRLANQSPVCRGTLATRTCDVCI
jgi:hypothetical protein